MSRIQVEIPSYEQSRGIQLAAGIVNAASLNQLPQWLVLEPWEWWMVWATAMQQADLLAYTAKFAAAGISVTDWMQYVPKNEIGGHLQIAKEAGGEEFYRAMRFVVRSSAAESRAASRDAPSPSWAQVQPTMPGAAIPIAVYAVAGVIAASVAGFFIYDRSQVHRTRRAVQITQVKALAEVMRQTSIAQIQAAAGQNISVGESITRPSRYDWVQSAGIGAAVFAGVVGGGITYGAVKKHGPAAYRRARAALPGRRANPKTRRRRNAGRRHPKMGAGYSQDTLGRNIEIMIRAGHTPSRASAIAYAMARRSYRRRHPRGSFPTHLKKRGTKTRRRPTRRKNAARRPVRRAKATPRRKNATKKKAAKRTRRANPKAAKKKAVKKQTTVRKVATKRNPKRAKKAPAKKAQFIRYAKRQGFTAKQSEAKWTAYRKRKR